MNEELEVKIMELVVNSGNARSCAMEAIKLAKEGKLEEANEKMKLAKEGIHEAHVVQTDLVQAEVRGEQVPMTLLMCHAQDHLMTAMVVIDLAEEFVSLYEVNEIN